MTDKIFKKNVKNTFNNGNCIALFVSDYNKTNYEGSVRAKIRGGS